MLEEARLRMAALQGRMAELGVPVAVFTDEASIAYLAGFWGYLGIEFGRPTMLVVRVDDDPVVITPLMESEMVGAMTWVSDVRVWEDAGLVGWARVLGEVLGEQPEVWVELTQMPAIVRLFFDERGAVLRDIGPVTAPDRSHLVQPG